jgi:hypothetical protein
MSTLTILERLLKDAEEGGDVREHVVESASYAVQNVDQKFSSQFEQVVQEISSKCGRPSFGDGAGSDGVSKIPPPSYVAPQRAPNQAHRVLKTSYWKEGGNITYVQLRFEMDNKQRPRNYEILLGAKKAVIREKPTLEAARHHDGPKGIVAIWRFIISLCRFG